MSNNGNARSALEGNLSSLLGLDDGGVSDVLDHLLMIENREDLLEYMSQLLGLEDDDGDVINFIDNVCRYQRGDELNIDSKKSETATAIKADPPPPTPTQTPTPAKKQERAKNGNQAKQTTTNAKKVAAKANKTPPIAAKDNNGKNKMVNNNDNNKITYNADATVEKKKPPQQQQEKTTTKKKPPSRGKAKVVCGCFGTAHPALTNCLYCGRISCKKEGYSYCPFCGYLVEKITIPKNESDKSSWLHKERLLQYDKESAKRTIVYDDQADFFVSNAASSSWLTQEEQKEAETKQETLRQQLTQRSKQTLQIAL